MTPKLRLFDLSIIVISFVIGMGIFRTPVNVAQDVPSTFVFFSAWIAGGLVALCGALTYAEIGSRMPVTGGYYKVFSYAYHPSVAFAVNCVILVSNAASLAGVALIGGEYITGVFIPEINDPAFMREAANSLRIRHVQMGIAISAILLFYGLNLLGLKMSSRTQNILMIIKVILVLLLIVPLFLPQETAPVALPVQSVSPTMNEYIKAFGLGLVAVSFTYGGYQQTINFGGEVKRPGKNLPRGILMGMITVIILYLAINYAYVKVIGFETLRESKNIAAIMASKVFSLHAERILSAFLFLSVLAYVNVLLLSNPRVMFAMSEDGILPKSFQRRNRKGAYVVSLTAFALLGAFVVFWAEEFDRILRFSIFLDCFGMMLSAGSIFILRKRTAHLDETGIFRMKLFPLLPLVFIVAYGFVAVSLLINETVISLVGLAVLSVFMLAYFGFMRRGRS